MDKHLFLLFKVVRALEGERATDVAVEGEGIRQLETGPRDRLKKSSGLDFLPLQI